MPNWAYNCVTITGPKDQREKFKEAVRREDGTRDFDFQKILPMPESLNLVAGGWQEAAVLAALLDEARKITNAIPDKDREPALLGIATETLTAATIYKEMFGDRNLETDQKRLAEMLKAPNAAKSRGVKYDAETHPETYQEHVDWGYAYLANYRKYGVIDWYHWCCQNWGTKWNAGDVEVWEQDDELCYRLDTAWSPPVGVIDFMPTFLKQIECPDLKIEWLWAEEQGYFGGTITVTVDDIQDDYHEGDDAAYAICEEVMGYSQRSLEEEYAEEEKEEATE